jgi:hypothetical protein
MKTRMSEPLHLDIETFTALAVLVGRARVSSDPKTALREWLVRDHDEVDALLRKARAPEAFDLEAFGRFRERLLRHIGVEERLLFSAIARTNQGQLPEIVSEVQIEHAALTSLLVPTPDYVLAEEIAGLLERHSNLEEFPAGVYDQCLAMLDDETADDVFCDACASRPVALAKYFDGAGTVRTADAALDKARRARAKAESGEIKLY